MSSIRTARIHLATAWKNVKAGYDTFSNATTVQPGPGNFGKNTTGTEHETPAFPANRNNTLPEQHQWASRAGDTALFPLPHQRTLFRPSCQANITYQDGPGLSHEAEPGRPATS